MLGLVLAVPLACAAAAPTAPDDPMNSKREVGTLFATLAIDQPLGEGVPLPGGRLAAVFGRRFGLEASVTAVVLAGTLGELSALGAVKLAGIPVLFKAGVSHLEGAGSGDHGFHPALAGFHVGASLLTGDVDDGVRWRFDYTYRKLGRYGGGVSTVGLGLVLNLASR
jgi:hypothetical protein